MKVRFILWLSGSAKVILQNSGEPEVFGEDPGLTQDFFVRERGPVVDESADLAINRFVLTISTNCILAVSPEMFERIEFR